MTDTTWSAERVEAFLRDGVAHLPGAYDPDLARACRALLGPHIGVDPGDAVDLDVAGGPDRADGSRTPPAARATCTWCTRSPRTARRRTAGTRPRFVGQPPLDPMAELEPDRPDGGYSPVERAVLGGPGREPATAARPWSAPRPRPGSSR